MVRRICALEEVIHDGEKEIQWQIYCSAQGIWTWKTVHPAQAREEIRIDC